MFLNEKYTLAYFSLLMLFVWGVCERNFYLLTQMCKTLIYIQYNRIAHNSQYMYNGRHDDEDNDDGDEWLGEAAIAKRKINIIQCESEQRVCIANIERTLCKQQA